MKGLRVIAALRARGARPVAAYVDLRSAATGMDGTLGHLGGVYVEIPASVGIADVDWRVFHGLTVVLDDSDGNRVRLHQSARQIAAVKPERLTVNVPAGDSWIVQRCVRGSWLKALTL